MTIGMFCEVVSSLPQSRIPHAGIFVCSRKVRFTSSAWREDFSGCILEFEIFDLKPEIGLEKKVKQRQAHI
jgi:hypothetical protein